MNLSIIQAIRSMLQLVKTPRHAGNPRTMTTKAEDTRRTIMGVNRNNPKVMLVHSYIMSVVALMLPRPVAASQPTDASQAPLLPETISRRDCFPA